MEIDKIIILLSGLGGIALTYWFFLMKKDEIVKARGEIKILVKGGYKPSVIEVPRGERTTLTFLREDPSTCLEEVILGDFKVKKYLPLNEEVKIEIIPQKKGVFHFSCGMNMFHGKVLVK
ncbi:MAG: cupredoxin domain-containing protein [Patescibacteria group bacterium]